MGYSLDELLDATGVSELSGGNLTKKAAASQSQDLSKLAQRCRHAVEATPAEVATSNQQELVEKTAGVAIITQTLAEIKAISGASSDVVKTAAQAAGPDHALFIRTSLDAGHSPHEIAQFIEKNAGLLGKAVRGVQARMASSGYTRAAKAGAKAEQKGARNLRDWQDLIRKSSGVSTSEKAALISRMRRDLGDQSALNAFSSMKAHGFKKLDAFKDLSKSVPAGAAGSTIGGKPLTASVGLGGKQVGLTGEQVGKMKKPALYAGAGYMGSKALSNKTNDSGSQKRGPVIITS